MMLALMSVPAILEPVTTNHQAVEVVGGFIAGFFLVAAAAVPAWLTYLTARQNKSSIEAIREQVLPNNGTRLWQYAQEARDRAGEACMTSAEALALAKEARITLAEHELSCPLRQRLRVPGPRGEDRK